MKTFFAALLATATLAVVSPVQAGPLNLVLALGGQQQCHRPYVMHEGRCVLPPRHEEEGPRVIEGNLPVADQQPTVGEWGDGKQMFHVEGTPKGFALTRLNEPEKSARCEPPRHLFRTDMCKKEENGDITCKLDCK
jgi:hypothetical protein